MHVKGFVIPVVTIAAQVALKCMCRSREIEKKIREVGKWSLRP